MAGAGRRTFTPGEVLTASNVMNYLQDQAVMNFAGTAARGSAIGTAVSEGMVSYLADLNQIDVYDGSAWQKVYPQAITPGLVPVVPTSVTAVTGSGSYNSTTGTVTFTNTTSILLSGIFTSAYKNYKVVVKTANSSNGANYYFRVGASGTEKTSGYYSETYRFTTAGASGITADTGGFLLGPTSSFGNYFASDTTVYAPYASERTLVSGNAIAEETTTNTYAFVHGGGIPLNDSYTDLKFYATTTSGLTGTLNVYGIKA